MLLGAYCTARRFHALHVLTKCAPAPAHAHAHAQRQAVTTATVLRRALHTHSTRLQLLLDRIAQRLASEGGGGAALPPRHMAHVVWAYAAFSEYPKQLLDTIAAAAAQRVGEFKPVSTARWARRLHGKPTSGAGGPRVVKSHSRARAAAEPPLVHAACGVCVAKCAARCGGAGRASKPARGASTRQGDEP